VTSGTHVRNYGAINVAPTQKGQALLSLKRRRPHFQTLKRSWNKQKVRHEARGDQKPRTTVMVRARSNLLQYFFVTWFLKGQPGIYAR
jgi:hypothetical protein